MRARDTILERFDRLDEHLQRSGFPPSSPWWRDTIARFLRSNARQIVIRAGRRGGKSSTLCRFAVAVAMFGEWQIPPGDVGCAIFISARRDEAAARLFTIATILASMGVAHSTDGDAINVTGRPIRFLVLPCTAAAVRGPTAILVVADEVSSWRDSESGANPASEVLAAVRPTLATTRGLIILSSSPRGMDDAHAKAFDQGDTAAQLVAYAPTWVANPTLTEADTHDLEPDRRIWSREYLAIPQASALAAFDFDRVEHAFRPWPLLRRSAKPVVIIDASSGRKDAWAWGIFGSTVTVEHDAPHVALLGVSRQTGRFFQQVSADTIADRVAADAEVAGATAVHGDQREAFTLESMFRKRRLNFTSHAWTQPTKVEAVARVRRWLAEGTLLLGSPDGATDETRDALRRELHAFEERITAGGDFTFAARGSGHDDLVALLVTLAMAEANGDVPRARAGAVHTPYKPDPRNVRDTIAMPEFAGTWSPRRNFAF